MIYSINTRFLILGAGLAGLELGRRLKALRQDFVILEKESVIGGLARTNKTGEYYWDFGVHALYSRDEATFDYFRSLPLNCQTINRNVKIFHTANKGKIHLLDYPFEMGVRELPLNHKIECIVGYLLARLKRKARPVTLEDWIANFSGFGIAKHFMVPYNNKIWSCDLSEVSAELVSLKIEPAPFIQFFLSAFGKKVTGRAYQARFIYPEHGIQSLCDYTAKDMTEHIYLNACVEKLNKENGNWVIHTADGRKFHGSIVISTIPLVELLIKIDLAGVEKHYDVFKWNNTYFVMIGLKNGYQFRYIKDCQWAFFKEDESFYRVSLMHNFSTKFPPTLVAEVTQKPALLKKTPDEIKNLVLADLVHLGIIESEDSVGATDIMYIPYTYPIPTPKLESTKQEIRQRLIEHNLYLLGRNGNWDYLNMDGVIKKVGHFVENLEKEGVLGASDRSHNSPTQVRALPPTRKNNCDKGSHITIS